MIPKTLRNYTCFVDGRGYLGRVEEIELPKLKLKTEEYRGGGMDAPIEIDQGMEKLECNITFAEYDPELFRLFGMVDGADVAITLRGAIQGDGAAEAHVVTLRGGFKEMDPGTWKAGSKGQLKTAVSARYYKLAHAGRTVIEIDIENMKRIVNGNDQLAGQRRALNA